MPQGNKKSMQPRMENAPQSAHVFPLVFLMLPHVPPSGTPGGGYEVCVCGGGICVTVVVVVAVLLLVGGLGVSPIAVKTVGLAFSSGIGTAP